jgi:serine/threonine-protein kinase
MDRIGDYEIERLVREGGMGQVFEARERLTGRRVALKLLRAGKGDRAARLFLGEMSILSRLDHPNVVRCLSTSEIDGRLVMALEYLEGQTLREVLRKCGALPPAEAVRITLGIARALTAAHELDPPVVHRDLKPENVFIDDHGVVKVMDFGVAKVLRASGTESTVSGGTPAYMSPEQIDGKDVTVKSDLYALGLIAYEMLAGSPPFASASPRDLMNLQCTADPPPFDPDVERALPRGFGRLVGDLLAKDPEDRPDTAADVVHELLPFTPVGGAVPPVSSDGSAKPRPSEAKGSRSPAGPHAKLGDRDVPVRLAWAIIVGLSLAAGTLTYAVCSRDAPPDDDRPVLITDPLR